ncbi:MAG: hypothetical protein B6I22_01615 [Desulfobacteraceae bacterium 4572_123]|nr:MAG: hypothetical protein B6I22_01615 [Desulfobacteraceae bacterium 4572_123]
MSVIGQIVSGSLKQIKSLSSKRLTAGLEARIHQLAYFTHPYSSNQVSPSPAKPGQQKITKKAMLATKIKPPFDTVVGIIRRRRRGITLTCLIKNRIARP